MGPATAAGPSATPPDEACFGDHDANDQQVGHRQGVSPQSTGEKG